jgi:hypothetical protein
MKKLIYFTLGNNEKYIELAKLCISSLYKNKYDGDFLFITNLKDEILNKINFITPPHFMELMESDLLESSANKLKIHLFDKINDYEKIIFSDLDILWMSSPDKMFDMIQNEKIYVSNEKSLMSEEWWGGNILNSLEKNKIIKDNILGINAGIFGFKSDMVHHFKNIEDFLNENKNLVNVCLEQPFLNVYLYNNNIYNTELSSHITHNGYNLENFNGIAIHFAGGPGNFDLKYEKMINFYNKNL